MIVLYPGTFDPITHGHTDLVRRASRLCERVVVGVAEHSHKSPCFSLARRVALAEAALAGLPRVAVRPFSGLTVEFARACGADAILRGLRAVSDFEFEFQLASMNRNLAPDIETLFLTPSEEFAYVSSSLVREIARHGGDVSHFVDQRVREALAEVYAHAPPSQC